MNYDARDPNAPVIRDNGNLGAMATDLSISQLPPGMSIEGGLTKNSYDQVSTTDLALKLKERTANASSTSMITIEK